MTHSGDKRPDGDPRYIGSLRSLNTAPEENAVPNHKVTRGLEISRKALYTGVCVAVGFATCAGVVLYKGFENGKDSTPQAAPTATIFLSPSAGTSQAERTATPSALASPTKSMTKTPSPFAKSASPSPSALSPSAETTTATPTATTTDMARPTTATTPTTPPSSTHNACPTSGYQVCTAGTWAYSYPDTTRGQKVYQFSGPTAVQPECKNTDGWVLVDFSNPNGQEAGYVTASAVKGNLGAVAVCA